MFVPADYGMKNKLERDRDANLEKWSSVKVILPLLINNSNDLIFHNEQAEWILWAQETLPQQIE